MTAPSTASSGDTSLTAPGAPGGVAPSLAWLLGRAGIGEEAQAAVRGVAPQALAPGAADPGAVVDALLAADQAPGALQVVACSLPPREGVWWAWMAARHATGVQQQRADQQHAQPPAPDQPRQLPPSPVVIETLAVSRLGSSGPATSGSRAATKSTAA